jgi:single-strand DNA-binding protein
MTEAAESFAGNLTDQPEVRYTEGGIARTMFRVAVSGRREQEASFLTVIVWRDQAEHAVKSLTTGSRVVVIGRLQQRSWTAEDGSARSTVEVPVEELGPSLRWAVGCSTGLRSAKLRRRPGGSWARPASTARVRERRGQMAGRGRADKELARRIRASGSSISD